MGDFENVSSGDEMPEMISHNDGENDLRTELGEILDNDSDSEEEDFVMDNDRVLFENEVDNVEQDVQITNFNIASLCKYGDKNVLSLTSEEENVIKQCKDPTLQLSLIQNRLRMQQQKQLYTRLAASLNSYRENSKRKCEALMKQGKRKVVGPLKTFIWKLGMPYVKDQQCGGAPPNRDWLSKVQNREFSITQFPVGRRWMDRHQMTLYNGVQTSYYNYCESQFKQQIHNIEQQIKKTDDDVSKQDLHSCLDIFQQELETLRKEWPRKTPPYGSNFGIDWNLIADTQLQGHHTVHECKAIWNIYLHPDINKKDWSSKEDAQIKELVIKYHYQDWDSLARELGTNRSGYLVCVHYYMKLCNKFRQDRFLPCEDKFLLEIVEKCRLGSYIPWGRVANYFEDRSRLQLYHRYKYYLSCKGITKGVFTEAEDILLMHLIQRFGKDFSKVSKFMPHRSCIQLRQHYNSYLKDLFMNLSNSTCVDDEKILAHVRVHGETWSDLARALSRTQSQVRHRYWVLKKWLDKHPNMKVEDVPRRKHTYVSQSNMERQRRMTYILKKLKKSQAPPSIFTVEALLKQQKKPDSLQARPVIRNKRVADTVTDYRLLEFWQGSCMLEKDIPGDDLPVSESAQYVYTLLEQLGLDMNELVEDATVESKDSSILTNYELEILKTLKAQSSDAAITSTSHSMPQHKAKVKSLMPPNWHTLLGMRTFLLKFELYKETTSQSFTSNVRLHSSKTGLEDEILWILQQNLLKLDEFSNAKVINERKLFATRFKALFKWPCMMSMEFLESLMDSTEEVRGSDIVIEPRKKGRPGKKTPKVLLMLEAMKQKLKAGNTSEEVCDDATDPPNGNNVTQQQGKPKNSKHIVRHLSKRAKIKRRQKKKKVEAEDLSDTRTELNQVGISKTINISKLKFPARNVPLIDSSALEKLTKANKSNKIVNLKQLPADKIQKPEKITKTCNLPVLRDIDNQAQASTSNPKVLRMLETRKRKWKPGNSCEEVGDDADNPPNGNNVTQHIVRHLPKRAKIKKGQMKKVEIMGSNETRIEENQVGNSKTINISELKLPTQNAQLIDSNVFSNLTKPNKSNKIVILQNIILKQASADKIQKPEKITKTCNLPMLRDVDNQAQASTSNPKVLQMVEAKKRKLKPGNTIEEVCDDADVPRNRNYETQQQEKLKNREHIVRHLPKRAKIKKGQRKKVETEGSNETRTEENQVDISKTINISELKLPTQNAQLIDSSILANLTKANSSNKIGILKQLPVDKIQKPDKMTKTCNLPMLRDVDKQAQASSSNPKVLRMLETRKRKLKPANTSKEVGDDADDPPNGNNETRQQEKLKNREHIVRHLPKRAKIKKGQKKEVETEGSNETRTEENQVDISKTINISELKLPTQNAQLIDSSVSANLTKANSSNKIGILKQLPIDKIQKPDKMTKTCNLPMLRDVDKQAQASSSNPKVLRMLETRKRKLKPANTSKEVGDDADDPPNGNNETRQQEKLKNREHIVRHLPKRAKIKKGQKKEVETEGSNESRTE